MTAELSTQQAEGDEVQINFTVPKALRAELTRLLRKARMNRQEVLFDKFLEVLQDARAGTLTVRKRMRSGSEG